MPPPKTYLWLTALFTLLFVLLLLIGSIFILKQQIPAAAAVFLLAFASIGGQMLSLAAFLKHKQNRRPNAVPNEKEGL